MIRDLISWIRLFFEIRRDLEPELSINDFSSELQDCFGRACGYGHRSNSVLTKFISTIVSELEKWHRWSNENEVRSKLYHFHLDFNSPKIQENLGRYEDDENKYHYWLCVTHCDIQPDKIVMGPFTQRQFVEEKRDEWTELQKRHKSGHRYYITEYPAGRRPYEFKPNP